MPDSAAAPKLAPPGAGLPLLQRLYARFYLGPYVAAKADWDESLRSFARETERILTLVEGVPAETLTHRTLVPPQQGLEDSSRFWSIAMTLDHLVIVGEAIVAGVIQLAKGEKPLGKVSIADVKPRPPGETGAAAIARFREFTAEAPARFEREARDRDSAVTHEHPWFGPFTARQWIWLLGVHQGIHGRQIQAILSSRRRNAGSRAGDLRSSAGAPGRS